MRAEAAMRAALAAEAEAPYAADLWTLEVRRAAARAGAAVPDLASRFPILELAASVARGLLPIDPAPRPVVVRFGPSAVRTEVP
jgi:hypothetical protein